MRAFTEPPNRTASAARPASPPPIVLRPAPAGRPHRLLSLGVRELESRRYGTPADHARMQGLDAAGIRRSVLEFLA
jgi:hypothetical protein